MEQPTSEAGRSVPRRLCASATAEPPADPLSRRLPVPRGAVRGVRALPRLIRPRFGSRVAVPAASTKAHDWGGGLKRPPWHQVEGGRVRAGDGWLNPGDRCAIRRGVEARGGPRRTGAAVPVPVARTTGGGDEPPSPQGP